MNRKEKYSEVLVQAKALIDPEADDIANMANLSRLLFDHFEHHWIGFYRVVGQQLVLGPFHGPVACTRIDYGKGVCGTAWKEAKTQVVEDVHSFPGHIACSALSNSEIVVPCIRNGKVYAVLDIDSTAFGEFTSEDQDYLEKMVSYL